MHSYYAFLRGINVGGKNIIPMDELREVFASQGFANVRTWIASGNVRFESDVGGTAGIKYTLEKSLKDRFSYPGPVILRREAELTGMVESDPFRGEESGKSVKWYVCLLESSPGKMVELPLLNEKEGLEIFLLSGLDLFLISRELKRGRYGFPNNFVEKEFGVMSTARNWNTLLKMVR